MKLKIRIDIVNIAITILAIVLTIASAVFYQRYQNKKILAEDVVDSFEEDEAYLCEEGKWISFPSHEKTSGLEKYENIEKLVFREKELFSNEDDSLEFTTHEDYSLYFFTDKTVEIDGVRTGGKNGHEIYVNRIKCAGKEADKDIQDRRQKIMDYINVGINDLAPEKSAGSEWQVETFYFYNDTDLYVDYESKASILEESPYDGKLWLVRVSKTDREKPQIETLAYIEQNPDDPEKNIVRQGEDLYGDQAMDLYEFDPKRDKWVYQ